MYICKYTDLNDFFQDLLPKNITLIGNDSYVMNCISGYSSPSPNLYLLKNDKLFNENVQVATYGDILLDGSTRKILQIILETNVKFNGIFQCISENNLTKTSFKSNASSVEYQGTNSIVISYCR